MDKKEISRGIRNNNPLNIEKGNDWKGERVPQKDRRFEEFESMEYGVRAGFKILQKYLNGYFGMTEKFNTIEKMISRWAPPKENNTPAYIAYVSRMTGIPSTQKISFSQRSYMVAIVDAMIRYECGQSIERGIIESAYDMV